LYLGPFDYLSYYLATLYDHMFIYVGLFVHCAVVFCVSYVFCRRTDCAVEFYD